MVAEAKTGIPEGRRAERVRTYIGARAVFNNGQSTMDCQVRNLSETGAKLTLSESVGLPSAFVLEIPSRNRSFKAELRWRAGDSVGVEFVNLPASEERKPGSGPDEVAALRAENALLRRRVHELATRLADLGHSERPD
ncbi:MAG: type pilus assembly PilZ [Hyphomicrobiales bacterium]|nr:type pilus assembly PilZ [Hyphomicrobiales bacterium]